jgi:hypothetical protein
MSPKPRRKEDRSKALLAWLTALFFLALWYVLLRAQNPGLMSDDSGEMAASAWNLGLPHPPGYPLFNLLGHIFLWLPIGSPAFRLNLFSQLLVFVSLWFILDTCRLLALTESWLKSASHWLVVPVFLSTTGIIFVSCQSVFAQCLTAKGCIYTLALFIAGFLVWVYIRWPNKRGRLFLLACFAWSLGMAHHWQTFLLWIPFLFVWAWFLSKKPDAKFIIRAISLAGIGVSLYLYLPFRAALHCQPCWGNPINLKEFYWVVSRQLVSGWEPWIQNPGFYIDSFKEFINIAFFYWMPGFAIMVGLGVIFFWRRDKRLLYLLLSILAPVGGAVFFIREPKNLFLIHLYLISLAGALLILGFFGILWLFAHAFKKQRPIWVLTVGLAVLSCWWLSHVFQIEDKSRYTMAEDFGLNALKDVPRGAVFLGDGDHYVMPIWYVIYARGIRPDVIFIPSVFLGRDWGWDQLKRQGKESVGFEFKGNTVKGRIDSLTSGELKVPLVHSLGWEFLPSLKSPRDGVWVLQGLAYQWEAKKPTLDVISESVMRRSERGRYRGLEEYWHSTGLDPSSVEIYRYYANRHFEVAHLLYLDTKDLPALKHFERGLDFHPTSALAYCDIAVVMGKWGYLEMAKSLCELGIHFDQNYLPCYVNLANAYWLQGDSESAISWYRKALSISPNPQEIEARIAEIKARPSRNVPANQQKTSDEYEKLGQLFRQQGLPRLASLASTCLMGPGGMLKILGF